MTWYLLSNRVYNDREPTSPHSYAFNKTKKEYLFKRTFISKDIGVGIHK